MTVARRPRRVWLACHAAPLMRFVAPAAHAGGGVHLRRAAAGAAASSVPGLPRPVRSVPRVSTLSTACASHRLPAVFQAGALMEFLTLQSFLLVRSRDASRRPLPSCHSPPAAESPGHCTGAPWNACGAALRTGGVERGFKALLPGASALPWPPAFPPPARSLLSWVWGPFRVFPPRPCAAVLPPGILPRAFERRSSEAAACAAASPLRHPGSPECSRGRDWPRLTAQQALLGFSTSSTPSHD
jgi:hypothetical protein